MAFGFGRKNEVYDGGAVSQVQELAIGLQGLISLPEQIADILAERERKQNELYMAELNKRDELLIELVREIKTMKQGNNEMNNSKPKYTTKSVDNLDLEKLGSEIISLLMDKMENAHFTKLRPFYTAVENIFKTPFSSIHKKIVDDAKLDTKGKYPYRKIDTILSKVDNPNEIYNFAKEYEFTN